MKGKITARDIVICALLAALLLVLQVALGFLPNIEVVSLLIIIYTLTLQKRTLWIIYVFALLEGLVYGFGIWWWNYLYVWTVLYAVTRVFRKNTSAIFWALLAGIYGLAFGFLCSLVYLTGGPGAMFANWISGIPFDLAHGAGNFVIVLIFYRPLMNLFRKIGKEIPG